jgi:hypothetical protein
MVPRANAVEGEVHDASTASNGPAPVVPSPRLVEASPSGPAGTTTAAPPAAPIDSATLIHTSSDWA